jgi:hypothetical protein
MDEDEEVFAIIYSKADVKQEIEDKAYTEGSVIVEPLEDDIYDALGDLERNIDVDYTFAGVCDDLVKEHLAKGK